MKNNVKGLIAATVAFCWFISLAPAQILEPVKWSFDSKKLNTNEYELQMTATIDDHWHMYSQHIEGDGPIPTSFTFENINGYELVGKVREPKPIAAFDPNFDMEIKWFEHSVTFRQKIKLTKTGQVIAKGYLEFMVCDDKKCLPPEYVDYEFKLVGEEQHENLNEEKEIEITEEKDHVRWNFELEELGKRKYQLTATAVIENGWHLYSMDSTGENGPIPTTFTFAPSDEYELSGGIKAGAGVVSEYDSTFDRVLNYFKDTAVFNQIILVKEGATTIEGVFEYMACNNVKRAKPPVEKFSVKIETTSSVESTANDSDDSGSLWAIFFIAFLSGFAALLTPCVFPMIPMTVSFFTKQSKDKAQGIRNAIFYGICIMAIYVVLGTLVTMIFGSDALNALSTNVYFNIFFFILLVVFAISFMGAFEIVLPSSWITRSDKGADKGGLIGIFFMAFTLALVSFSCTGPIVGTLLVQSATIGGVGPFVGMLGFSLALALPFGLFAAFPGWLNSLPQSGGWLNTVKVFLGFLELALAFKFLSNADLVVQTHLLEREVFIAIWIGVFFTLGLYLFGFIQLPHDSPIERLSVGRTLLGILTLVFVMYLIPGMWGAPLKLISGFPPPQSYSEAPHGFGGSGGRGSETHGPPGTHLGPQDIYVFHDLDEGLAYAKEQGKPAFLDFTGWACVNCRKMEEYVWGEPGIIEILRDQVVIISLYVDDKRDLPEEEQKEVTIGSKTKKLRSIGNKWSYIQATRYLTNTQPYYRMLGPQGEDLANGSADYEHHGNVTDFRAWLEEGIALYKAATN